MSQESNVCLALLVIVIIFCVASTIDFFYKKPCGCRAPCNCYVSESVDGVDPGLPNVDNNTPEKSTIDYDTGSDDSASYGEVIKNILPNTITESHAEFVEQSINKTSTASGDTTTDHENILNPRQGFRGLNTAVSHTPYARQVPSSNFDEFPEYKPACF
jgi:hypothetical protein